MHRQHDTRTVREPAYVDDDLRHEDDAHMLPGDARAGLNDDESGTEAVGAGIGALGGAGIGMAVGGPPGAVVGGVAGAVAGAVAGEAAEGDGELGSGTGAAGGGLAGAALGGGIAGPPGAVVGGAVGAAGGAGVGDKLEEVAKDETLAEPVERRY